MDHLFLQKDQPELLVYFTVAFILCSKSLMQVSCVEELQAWQNQTSGLSFAKIMSLAAKLLSKYQKSVLMGQFQ